MACDLPAVIDIEASGFGRGSYPIEVGFVTGDGAAGCTLIRPEADWVHWDEQAQRTHGLSRETLLAHGRDCREVAHWLNQHLAGQEVVCDAWAHDYPWLSRLFDSAEVVAQFHLRDLRELLSPDELEQFVEARQQARDQLVLQRHRASSDARVLQLAIARLRGA
jgi:hypothetical protein